MRSNRVTFIIVLQAIMILAGACAKKSDEPSTNRSRHTPTAGSTQISHSQGTPQQSNVYIEEVKAETHAEQAGQVLQDISEAKVQERAHNLKQPFGRLDAICTKAVSTCTDLLAADYVTDRHRELLAGKEARK